MQQCSVVEDTPKGDPCSPSPCGPNSICRENNRQPVCSCVAGFLGIPPSCRPECTVSSECLLTEACSNQKCINPCLGACGIQATCQVINHNPICSCGEPFTGDPFIRCVPRPPEPVLQTNPCVPSPCGANAECRVVGDAPSCSCLTGFLGSPPYCKPECISNSECPAHLACMNQKCRDPCEGSCGANAECRVVSHTPMCVCPSDFTGDPFTQCIIKPPTPVPLSPCKPSPCGFNAVCKEQFGAGSCSCLPDYVGNPYEGCRPECVVDTDCISILACVQSKCRDPCPGVCGQFAECQVINHRPSCTCVSGYSGNPFQYCTIMRDIVETPRDVCNPSPCGPNSQCRVNNNQAVCSCVANFIGSPPACRPECVTSSDCPLNLACLNQKCQDPCPGSCGRNSNCRVIKHNPICSCRNGFTGDPFTVCFPTPVTPPIVSDITRDPCVPSPCGMFSECRDIGGVPSCSCLPTYRGSPPNCKPECTINAECPANMACMQQKCRDPCLGSCGIMAECSVVNHVPICSCLPDYTGDPFIGCSIKPPVVAPPKPDPCTPSPCGSNTQCNGGICVCLAEYFGDPYSGCRPECVLNNDCPNTQACVRNKCVDPCPGVCGQNAICNVYNHVPMCSCPSGMDGNAFVLCSPVPAPPISNPCNPSPCGPNSQCRENNMQAVCSCINGFVGAPPTCRPECVISSDCPKNEACTNQKCRDPCPGSCGRNTDCNVINHNPVCVCRSGMTGDPFINCFPLPEEPLPVLNPCQPSPCGPNAQCQVINDQPSCSCLQEFIGSPPNCRYECISNSECSNKMACINQKCRDPCINACGINAICNVVSHTPMCACTPGYTGDPFTQCSPQQFDIQPSTSTPCTPSPCGANAICRVQQNAGSCSCTSDYIGNPYEGCRPECTLNSDCPSNQACIGLKCKDPCPGTCGQNAQCYVINHAPTCTCFERYTGNPFIFCSLIVEAPVVADVNPCQPSPCGPYSQCRASNGQAVCSCLPTYIGAPPGCRPECTVSTDCATNRACENNKCVDPCPNSCGQGTTCRVVNHSPICMCKPGFSGDPFVRCLFVPPTSSYLPSLPSDPCIPSPCGPNSQCRNLNGYPSCSCMINYIGTPPNCRPECIIPADCASNQACIRERCQDPCPGSCGLNADCTVHNHIPICRCIESYTGDPFIGCQPVPIYNEPVQPIDPCSSSPCGPNAQCNNGICTCLFEYFGDPYVGCRPECVLSTDCSTDKACIRNKCVDPCPGTCGQNSLCNVINHTPMCSCPPGTTGNAFISCDVMRVPPVTRPCSPNPCGPNSICRELNGQAVCACAPEFLGSPPLCRPECTLSSDCRPNEACANQKCKDPCPGTCGIQARCVVVNHNPVCSCPERYTGDPFIRCDVMKPVPPVVINPCQPSPCGPYAQCQVVNDLPSCSCLPEYKGSPPYCQPECISNPECPSHQSCVRQKCRDPCPGLCGENAECHVVQHVPHCVCSYGLVGDPYTRCSAIPRPTELEPQPSPCASFECGANAICRERDSVAICQCISSYVGNPYLACRPECVINPDCPSNLMCVRNKCANPCAGMCGQNAECSVVNHQPMCTCLPGYTGDPFITCSIDKIIPDENVCAPSPCGPNSKCKEVSGQAVCSCLPTYIGTPPACRPECVASSECSPQLVCKDYKCVNPCPTPCGLNTNCVVVNHSPICSCMSGYSGDPFTICSLIPPVTPPLVQKDPCVPSPCGSFSQCRNIGGSPACTCLENYMGQPPNCRPECTIHSECPSDRACINMKCVDPCPGSCGTNALCSVINHIPTCRCPEGYTGNTFVLCEILPVTPIPSPVEDACVPSPCGPNAQCFNGICTCLPEFRGDPNVGCRPECVLNADCSRDRACIRNKCLDPCPGACASNALCTVIGHVPMCSCPGNMTGNAFSQCTPLQDMPPANPCAPSPCGPNSECRVINNQAVCSCIRGYLGSPPTCRPECIVSTDCPQNEACSNQKCTNPCPGSCGLGASCQVVNHNPICTCPLSQTGDPFVRCYLQPQEAPALPPTPCRPNPCGPNSQCQPRGDESVCTCLPDFIGSPPNCRAECISNSECSNHLACINKKCQDPCVGSCGANANCHVVSHTPMCSCVNGYTGDPFTQCILREPTPLPPAPVDPCTPSPCGSNAICKEFNGAGSCTCLPNYTGNPYEGCRPECILNSDCPANLACINTKCRDPCPGSCGRNALCQVVNHLPMCNCYPRYTGDAFSYCTPVEIEGDSAISNPCQPSPCGPNSLCRVVDSTSVCSCLPDFQWVASPPNCRPECTVSAECAFNLACISHKCSDPCRTLCGSNARCETINHNPICSCPPSFTGDPFVACFEMPPKVEEPRPFVNPCAPSPCGPYSECRDINGQASCACLSTYIGTPPNCRPECSVNPECSTNQACIQRKCRNPCDGVCGVGAICNVIRHTPTCSCPNGFTGDPFIVCRPMPEEEVSLKPTDPCLSCGSNTQCFNGICSCLPEYQGNPNLGCRPECILNSDCLRNQACIKNKCRDPCGLGICGINAVCSVINHVPVCTCAQGMSGNAFMQCSPINDIIPKDPCNPTPCGPNSQCRRIKEQAVCSCLPGYLDAPPNCRAECTISSDCLANMACNNQKCIDPCPGTCGIRAQCTVVNHNPICSCLSELTGDPFTQCIPRPAEPPTPINPCVPSPCGLNSKCEVVNNAYSCSCLPEFVGNPPNCRPECISNSECPTQLACINQKCRDPCPGSCGINSDCRVISHTPMCVCLTGFEGDPFVLCNPKQNDIINAVKPTPCVPSPCGFNAVCRESNGVGSCTCLQDYTGNPYDGCRPECTINSDCTADRACVGSKCQNPCPGFCGYNAICQVINHAPLCTCQPGYSGNPFISCNRIVQDTTLERNPCSSSPCGLNSQCRELNGQAICSCLPTFIGTPPNCRAECTVSSDCSVNRACKNRKCVDPCPGICGINARCEVINHSPICSCNQGFTGDPFVTCFQTQIDKDTPQMPENPCIPSPCGPFATCRDSGYAGVPTCTCLENYIGSPPNCRPECTVDSECSSNQACLRQKCRDPCPGSCGIGAQCLVVNHMAVCLCPKGYTGDAFASCFPEPPPPAPMPQDPCNPSPCGVSAICRDGVCTCQPEYRGDPYVACRPECVQNPDCPLDKACVRNKCLDPCTGVCGQNAKCTVINHTPMCACPDGMSGNAFATCYPIIQDQTVENPCNPSPCGPNSRCQSFNNQAVCTCIPGFIGNPPACRPECIVNTDCALNEACINMKCGNPCLGACGISARCQVLNHNPICTCPPVFTGDPFIRCIPRPEDVPKPINPCQPSPCGPNSQCQVINDTPSCSCMAEFIGTPPNCRPECISNSECPSQMACINRKCRDPCPGSCHPLANCFVVNHVPTCTCRVGYTGDPFVQCTIMPSEPPAPRQPCQPSPCGTNAVCREQNGVGSCTCLSEYIGNPYEGCRPECTISSDCPAHLACIGSKCQNPCPGSCGTNTNCQVVNNVPVCTCIPGYTGNPYINCIYQTLSILDEKREPCKPSPCGPNSQCADNNGQAICSCLPQFIGTPPNCRPECLVNSECGSNRACVNQKCVDPCIGTCGRDAQCKVIHHSPICICASGFTGDPFIYCFAAPIPKPEDKYPKDPCLPSPCGPNALCRAIGDAPACSCMQNYIGVPPNCRPECSINSDCPANRACIREKCRDPCPGSCGLLARCSVINHTPACTCPEGYTGDPFVSCNILPQIPLPPPDQCNPSPCGQNAQCNNGICTCIPEYFGDPYAGCRPECVINTDCLRDRACVLHKCRDPCVGTCGFNAECIVVNHLPMCSCPRNMTGNAFVSCTPLQDSTIVNEPCNPSPCGPNSHCRASNGQAICACIAGFRGAPPSCRPECLISADCARNRACSNQKCIDPCLGACGLIAQCAVVNHNPICSCPPLYTGDPFVQCVRQPEEPQPPIDPCQPSPCGPNAICRVLNGAPSCSCLPQFIGTPPRCRPECISNSECPSQQACINQKCRDPCPGSCGRNAECRTVSHTPMCICAGDFTGDPFIQCNPRPIDTPLVPLNPCQPSPCGANAMCREISGSASCTCLPDFYGNPYEGCRPECVINSDCTSNRACIRNRCQDPCPGTCGVNAICEVINHIPACSCQPRYTGDPFRYCEPMRETPPVPVGDPCQPSPCGPNSRCLNVNEKASCSCLPTYQGTPPDCRPECVVSTECPMNRACVNQKCVDPCPGVCGINAKCNALSHSPFCSCGPGQIGDPFVKCFDMPLMPAPPLQVNPCVPSPCGPFSTCQDRGGYPSCTCMSNYIGSPPYCRAECSINSDCTSDKACIREKCRDPCPGSCGFNALCSVINHTPACTCPNGYTGDPFNNCYLAPMQVPTVTSDPCNPSPCGLNAECRNGRCNCIPEYRGDPYRECRPECVQNSDCPFNRACANNKCVDPCVGICGQNAECAVINHVSTCSCVKDYEGDPFTLCRRVQPRVKPCEPSPCGPNSVCREFGEQASCSCLPGYFGIPPSCRPECLVSTDCEQSKACVNMRCRNPCENACGQNALCVVRNHNPICRCPVQHSGDPFVNCFPITIPDVEPTRDPCYPSPCGLNSQCTVSADNTPSCSCLPTFIGSPPNCRPECHVNSECPTNRACIKQKCTDPCVGLCGFNALCQVTLHQARCTCPESYTGDPFTVCSEILSTPTPSIPSRPCSPSPCGINAYCHERFDTAICECVPNYRGNPYQGCQPECLVNTDCPKSQACIKTRCQDPCPGTCGVGAICTVSNHVPICSCPLPTIGDAFTLCQVPVEDTKEADPCYPSPCGPNTVCEKIGNTAVCKCLPGLQGVPTSVTGCNPECVLSSDCPGDKACIQSKCKDPCSQNVCGSKAVCKTINHSPLCSCPSPLIGNPFEECYTKIETNPCSPSPCNYNGECRVRNGVAICIYPECVINSDCPRDKACFSQKCRDPCIGACGINSICQTVNHKPICSCPVGFTGNARVQCTIPALEEPVPECTQNSECSNDKTCFNQKCVDPCTLDSCGFNSRCHVQMHRAICVCNDGYTGYPQQYCHQLGCRSDSECSLVQSCINNECVDTCLITQCGINALCTADGYHKTRCYCPDGYTGNPYEACERPECTSDSDCAPSLACRNLRCVNPCNCPPPALCNVVNHRPICKCPPGYVGNPYTSCLMDLLEPETECQVDADCPSKLACFSGICKDPCAETKPCIASAKCSVVDTLPMRTMICECLPNFAGDATVACVPVDKQVVAICESNSQCTSDMACLNRRCINPCTVNPCAANAECHIENHHRICQCPHGYAGDPFINCYEENIVLPECRLNTECPSDKACINQLCQDPCSSNHCGLNAECITINHHPSCHCQHGFAGDPQAQCFRPECKTDNDCPYDKTCRNDNCVTPCLIGDVVCGRGAECRAVSHRAQCICPQGTQGDPRVACISAICHYNEDCADHEACDRLNRVCRPVCDDDACDESAICVARDHQPKCTCPPGTVGNPYITCIGEPSIEPECTQDSECALNLACVNTKCQDPCLSGAGMCTSEQECKVLNTIPLRTMICLCPPNTITDVNGQCKQIVLGDVQCHLDQDCANQETCLDGKCVDACLTTQCGFNAQCKSTSHTGICFCSQDFTGNAYIECIRVPVAPLPGPRPECYTNSECARDRQCINSLCVNPCVAGDPCGRSSLCHVDNHNPICKCPIGYIGDPLTKCIPPEITPECVSNSECAGNYACVNGACINPCNCGPNAKCNVVNHYPTCVCPPSYSGNPQLGCFKLDCESDSECDYAATCYNGQCVNPCILDNKCAINAECYGKNHRSACRCGPGYFGNPQVHCERVECNTDHDCPYNLACNDGRCVNPCAENSPCAQNAVCYVQDHVASCRCPVNIPLGNPFSYCERHVTEEFEEPECRVDIDCSDKLVCIREKCIDPCPVIKPCLENARCDVLDTVPVRTMICTCPEGWITDVDGVCRPIQLTVIGTCTTNDDCSDREACINRQCRNPCNCGTNAVCYVRNHKPICSCEQDYQGNPEIACHSVECRHDSQCTLDKTCENNNCVNPCLVADPCGTNAECFPNNHVADCRCRKGYHGNPLDRCRVIGCYSNGDCPGDHSCINMQCIDPCVHDNPCSPRAECRVLNHLPICRCPSGFTGNPYVNCQPEIKPECREDSDCPDSLACLSNKCQIPCPIIQPCTEPSECRVLPTHPIRTMACVCPSGYVSSGSGTCRATKPILKIECTKDDDCPSERSCVNAVCRNPCACGPNAVCNVINHKPICSCTLGYDGNPDILCTRVAGCRTDGDCSGSHTCVQRNCVPACSPSLVSCGKNAVCHGIHHKAICECLPGFGGNPRVSCVLLGCRTNSDCPTNKACINNRCENPCVQNPCTGNMDCNVYNHVVECACPPGYVGDVKSGCTKVKEKCKADNECPSQTACFNGQCINPCTKIAPCGINAECKVLDTSPIRTMICECLPGYRGNAIVRCDLVPAEVCPIGRGQIRDEYGNCVCPLGFGKDANDVCIPCRSQSNMVINEEGYCVCDLEKGFSIDEYGRCVCPTRYGYGIDTHGYCRQIGIIECRRNDDCADDRYCDKVTHTCQDPCKKQQCGVHALCNATRHQAVCICVNGYLGNPYTQCFDKKDGRTDFPKPDIGVSCLSDGVQVVIHLQDQDFDGVLYVKGRSKDEQCRRVVSIPAETDHKTETFKVAFDNCGLIHVNVS